MTDEAPAVPLPLEIQWLRLRTKDPEDIVRGLLDRLASTEADAAATQASLEEAWEAHAYAEGQVERLVARGERLDEFSEAIQGAHVGAHHSGRWETCPNLVCRGLEDWMLRARKDQGAHEGDDG